MEVEDVLEATMDIDPVLMERRLRVMGEAFASLFATNLNQSFRIARQNRAFGCSCLGRERSEQRSGSRCKKS